MNASPDTPPPESSDLIRADRLDFAYPDQPLFRALSFTVGPGLSVVRAGDGKGKSTLLRLMAGALAPSAGQLWRAPATVFFADPRDEREDALTARQCLRAHAGRFPDWNAAREQAMIERFGLAEHLDKGLFMLSTGTRRKVWLVAACASGARLVLLDQPFGALDAPARAVVAQCLTEAARDPVCGWVVADHELPASLADVVLAGVIDLGD
jgi:ABC-type multidrug transport system ATPase subunit